MNTKSRRSAAVFSFGVALLLAAEAVASLLFGVPEAAAAFAALAALSAYLAILIVLEGQQ